MLYDIHTHILPGMDDGSADVSESVAMLGESAHQGVGLLAATPHFYAGRETPDEFFARRAAAMERLKPALSGELPRIALGAEVRYFEGLANMDELPKFCIEGTKLLLIEMPVGMWSDRTTDILAEINERRGLRPVFVHFERYMWLQPRKTWRTLRRGGAMFQANSDSIISRELRGRLLFAFNKGWVDFIASDCHNMNARPPSLAQAMEIVDSKLGSAATARLNSISEEVFNEEEL
jgi:protein-tyrosine phosphatase